MLHLCSHWNCHWAGSEYRIIGNWREMSTFAQEGKVSVLKVPQHGALYFDFTVKVEQMELLNFTLKWILEINTTHPQNGWGAFEGTSVRHLIHMPQLKWSSLELAPKDHVQTDPVSPRVTPQTSWTNSQYMVTLTMRNSLYPDLSFADRDLQLKRDGFLSFSLSWMQQHTLVHVRLF